MNLVEIRQFAESKIDEHLDDTWRFKFINNRRLFGRCVEKGNGGVIQISTHHCIHSDEEYIKDTILHEIAHALVGTHNGHNEVWKEMAVKVGAKPEQYADADEIKYRYYLVHEESKTIVDRTQTVYTKWVREPTSFSIKGKPETVGELKVLTYEQVIEHGYIKGVLSK